MNIPPKAFGTQNIILQQSPFCFHRRRSVRKHAHCSLARFVCYKQQTCFRPLRLEWKKKRLSFSIFFEHFPAIRIIPFLFLIFNDWCFLYKLRFSLTKINSPQLNTTNTICWFAFVTLCDVIVCLYSAMLAFLINLILVFKKSSQ